MKTLSLLPDLLTFSLIAPFLLRVTVGFLGILIGWSVYKKSESNINKTLSLPYFITGLFLIIGMYTQAFAIVGIFVVLLNKYLGRKTEASSSEKNLVQILISVILLSLLFTGPGFLAIDYPL